MSSVEDCVVFGMNLRMLTFQWWPVRWVPRRRGALQCGHGGGGLSAVEPHPGQSVVSIMVAAPKSQSQTERDDTSRLA